MYKKYLFLVFVISISLSLLFCSNYHKEVKVKLGKQELYIHCVSKGFRTTYEFIVINNSAGEPDLDDTSSTYLVLETDQIFYQSFADSLTIFYNYSNSKLKMKNLKGLVNLYALDFREYNDILENYKNYNKIKNINYFGVREED